MYKRILVSTDGSKLSQKASRTAVRLAKGTGAAVTGVYVVAPYAPSAYAEGVMYTAYVTPGRYKEIAEREAKKALAAVYNLIDELDALAGIGVDAMRISPQSRHTPEIIALFRQCASSALAAAQAARELEQLAAGALCNGYWHGKPELEQVAASHRTVEA